MSSTQVMMQSPSVHVELCALDEPFETDTLLQVRTGKIKPFFNLPSPSAIFKTPRQGKVEITTLGAEGDQQAYALHGGPDKALLHYCNQHYPQWQKDMPKNAHRFVIGGFGENIVSSKANERNVCIGDVISIGSQVKVQVSEPRMPCYKLNHRFQISDMSRRSQDKRRTGWYYRVLQPGYIQAGDKMKLVSRPHPQWSVATVQHYLHQDMRNMEATEQLANLPELGLEIRTLFGNRLRRNFENENGRLVGGQGDTNFLDSWRDYRVVERRRETPRICSFVLEAVEPAENEERVEPGSHVRLQLPGKLVRAYSVIGDTSNKFEVGIALEPNSRGGSRYLHEVTKIGDILPASKILSSFPLSPDADHHILIAGGVGITAFVASAEFLQRTNQPYTLHLAVRSAHEVPFRRHLDPLGANVRIHDKSANKALNLLQVISKSKGNTHVYCCGPPRLMEAVAATATSCGVPPDSVHFEAFEIATSGDPFTAEVVNQGKKVEVRGEQTLLQALQDAGLDVPSSCEAGNCGTCRVNVCAGRVEHRGTGLMECEKASVMLSCVSRGVGHIVIEV